MCFLWVSASLGTEQTSSAPRGAGIKRSFKQSANNRVEYTSL
ncbi:hypothetical protein PRUB_a2340 [Pseudoalteromonas rubra]|uniref:Uncharacterized protein n=1 Tax=Pseudoalteromonas rubra TaxID=43658 RepID=A0A8T0CBV2_9GAMM|nr:hypothetical protein PRUB_a2340 [Pseudoalteromonas rubra]